MDTEVLKFSNIVDVIHNLPLDEQVELKNILEHTITEKKRTEIFKNFNKSKQEQQEGNLKFSSNIEELKDQL